MALDERSARTPGEPKARYSTARGTAVVVATAPAEDGGPGSLLRVGDESALSRLLAQLRSLDVAAVHVLTRPDWVDDVTAALPDDHADVLAVTSLGDALDAIATLANADGGPLLLAYGEIITQQSVLAGLLLDPRVPSGIVSSARNPDQTPLLRVRIERGRVTAAESPYHSVVKPNGAFLGLLKVAQTERAAVAGVAREIADLCRESYPPLWEPELATKVEVWGQTFFRRKTSQSALADQLDREAGNAKWLPDPERIRKRLDASFRSDVLHPAQVASEDVVSLLLTGVCRAGIVLTTSQLRELFWARPFSQERATAAAAEMVTVDEDRVLLNSAVKGSDGFFTTFFVSTYSRYIARWAARRGMTPNQVTVVSMLLGAAAAAAFAAGTRTGLVAGAVLLQVAFTADCVDGQLARYTRQFSKLGAWLDSVFDRGKEYLVFAGLAFGAAGADAQIWLLAAAALALQTTRHAIDFSWAQGQHQAIASVVRWPMTDPGERSGAGKLRDGRTDTGLLPSDEQPLRAAASAPTPSRQPDGILAVLGRAGVSASHHFEQRGWMKWAKRIVVLPIGERFALISITAALWGPRVTFVALLVWGSVALLYSLTGRVLRSLT